jgi:hydroxyethylthiazole kinase
MSTSERGRTPVTSTIPSVPVDARALGDALALLRTSPPLVQCITNIVVAQWSANVLLAAGAAPAMVDNQSEAGPFAAAADAVLINLGTPYNDTAEAMIAAVATAAANATPWVLDPVAVGPLAWRTELAHALLATGSPAVIRGNASEILALGGGTGGKGVDSLDTPEGALNVAHALALRYGTVVAVSGAVDHITDGDRTVRVSNGHPVMTQVTGVGCALGALIAAFAGTVDDRLLAATAATAMLTVAADAAAISSSRPGSFAVALLDELSDLSPNSLSERVRLS